MRHWQAEAETDASQTGAWSFGVHVHHVMTIDNTVPSQSMNTDRIQVLDLTRSDQPEGESPEKLASTLQVTPAVDSTC
eukprot:1920858-Rhodomonas_salina.2